MLSCCRSAKLHRLLLKGKKFNGSASWPLRQLGSKVKGKTTQLEQLLVREKGELDAIMVHFGVSRGQGAGGAIEPIYELLETLCTSLPNSLLEMRGRYLQLYNQDLVDAIRRVS